MKEKILSVSCSYSEDNQLAAKLIQESFQIFLKKELISLDIQSGI